MADTEIFEANLDLTLHSQAVLELLNAHAADPMENGKPLNQEVLKELIPGLQHHPTTIIFLAFYKKKAVGIVICFKGFAPFQARSLIHISNFFLQPDYQGLKINKKLLEAVETKALELNCCKITSAVHENNRHAIQVYTVAGFHQTDPVKETGSEILFSKPLSK